MRRPSAFSINARATGKHLCTFLTSLLSSRDEGRKISSEQKTVSLCTEMNKHFVNLIGPYYKIRTASGTNHNFPFHHGLVEPCNLEIIRV